MLQSESDDVLAKDRAGSWKFPKLAACITGTSARRRRRAPAVLTTIEHASQVQLSRLACPLRALHRDSGVTVQGRRSNDAGRLTSNVSPRVSPQRRLHDASDAGSEGDLRRAGARAGRVRGPG